MKKGCFLIAVFCFTLIVGIGFYVYKKYGYKFEEFSQERIMDFAFNELEKKIYEVKPSEYKDSLIIFVENKRNQFNIKAFEKYKDLLPRIKYCIIDGEIDSTEFYSLKYYKNENERSTHNRN